MPGSPLSTSFPLGLSAAAGRPGLATQGTHPGSPGANTQLAVNKGRTRSSLCSLTPSTPFIPQCTLVAASSNVELRN